MLKTSKLRKLTESKDIGIIMEAHNGITAKLVEEAGFKAIWASSLAMSAALGVRDNNEASWTQILDMLEFMSDCTSIPILLDGDTGYGDYNNFRRAVRKIEQRGVAGVCIEDKLFPKANSFINGEAQTLAPIDEFCGKIKAGKDAQSDKDFMIVARVEAFIAGWGLDEAIKRAEAYSKAGADAVLIHSKIKTADEITSFMKEWKKDTPVVIVPTSYPDVPLSYFQEIGIGAVIWANQTIRTVITSVRDTLFELSKNKNLAKVDKRIVSISEIFNLQDVAELKDAENRYLPRQNKDVSAIILAASKGEDFGKLTEDKPKCMISVLGKPILAHIQKAMNNNGIKNICAVTGYKKETVNLAGIECFENKDYKETGILYSLFLASERIKGNTLISFGDIIYESHILRELLESDGDITLAVDTSWCQNSKNRKMVDYVTGEKTPSFSFGSEKTTDLKEIRNDMIKEKSHGEWIGLTKLTPKGSEIINKTMLELKKSNEESFKKMSMVDFFTYLLKKGVSVKILYLMGCWMDVDNIEDVSNAYNVAEKGDI